MRLGPTTATYLDLGSTHPVPAGASALTVEAWMRVDKLPSSPAALIGQQSAGYAFILGYHDAAGNLSGYVTTSTGSKQATTPAGTLRVGEMQHHAVVWDGATLTYLLDGHVVSTVPASGTLTPNTAPYYIGRWGNVLEGSVRDLRIWRTARTQAEVRKGMVDGITGMEQGLVAWYPLDRDAKDYAAKTMTGPGYVATTGVATAGLSFPDRPLPLGDWDVEQLVWLPAAGANDGTALSQRAAGATLGGFQVAVAPAAQQFVRWAPNGTTIVVWGTTFTLPTGRWVWTRWRVRGTTWLFDVSTDDRASWANLGATTVSTAGMYDAAEPLRVMGNVGGGTYNGRLAAVRIRDAAGVSVFDWSADAGQDTVAGVVPTVLAGSTLVTARPLDGTVMGLARPQLALLR
jgi:hypothetical protein